MIIGVKGINENNILKVTDILWGVDEERYNNIDKSEYIQLELIKKRPRVNKNQDYIMYVDLLTKEMSYKIIDLSIEEMFEKRIVDLEKEINLLKSNN